MSTRKINGIINRISKGESTKTILESVNELTGIESSMLLEQLSIAYYHMDAVADDSLYDCIEAIHESKYGKNKKIGAPVPDKISRVDRAVVSEGAKVKLPYYMGGLDKLKDTKQLDLWLNRSDCKNVENFIVSDKLDGVSACMVYKNGTVKLYKRGDETEGTDISYLLPYIVHPKVNIDIAVRGELVIPINVFDKKYSGDFKNPRNLVAGLTNPYTKELEPSKLQDIHFVPYQIWYDKEPDSISCQLNKLFALGFECLSYVLLKRSDITEENMINEIKFKKSRSKYEMDGVAIAADIPIMHSTSGNPSHIAAFKIMGETAITEVIDVEWNVSKHGLFKPIVLVKTVRLSGVDISKASGFNARFIVDKGIGPGATVLITRSGDVIPDIIDSIKKVEPSLPDEPFEWNKTLKEITIVAGSDNENMKIKKIVAFFKELGAKFLAEKTIAKLYENGYDTLSKLFKATPEDIMTIEGFKVKSAERIVDSIANSIKNVPLHKLMAASSIFPNMGAKRLKLIVDGRPDVLEVTELEIGDLQEYVEGIRGFNKLAETFVDNILEFKEWLKKHPEIKVEHKMDVTSDSEDELVITVSKLKPPSKTADNLYGANIVCTGWRPSTHLEAQFTKRKVTVSSGVSKNTKCVVAKSLDKLTGKIKDAQERGVEVLTKKEFIDRYNLSE